jgi:hypothetical protein
VIDAEASVDGPAEVPVVAGCPATVVGVTPAVDGGAADPAVVVGA